MKWKNADLQTRLNLIAAAVLLVGLGAALGIYLTAASASGSAAFDDFIGSKRYAHELRLYGGTASVMADRFSRWFNGLWQGQTLACTIAGLAVAIAVLFFLAARHSAPDRFREEERD